MPDLSGTQILPWQQAQWRNMQAAIAEGRLPHALLLTGQQGIGKMHFARCLAAALLCQSSVNGHACGKCNACHLLQVGNHPDLHLIEPEEKGGVIKVDSIRKLVEENSLTPHLANIKLHIIRDADRMNIAAANSLLKTLEEPSPNTLILLVCAHTENLPATIKSRCQKLAFPLPDAGQALQWLQQQGGDAAEQLLALAGGAPLAALDLQQQDALQQRDELFQALLQISRGKADPVKIAAHWEKQDIHLVLQWLTIWVIDLIRLKYESGGSLLHNRDQLEQLSGLSRRFSLPELFGFYDKFLQAGRLADRQLNRTLLLENLLLPWAAQRN
ncbi:MAG: DNA polymerase III subunit delta' [Chromatiales bacterium]|jgi:DNA polymerase-3 subunit delta'